MGGPEGERRETQEIGEAPLDVPYDASDSASLQQVAFGGTSAARLLRPR